MTEVYNRILNHKPDHSTYSGELSLFDCEGHHTLTSMANKIVNDKRFDENCRKNIENRNRRKE